MAQIHELTIDVRAESREAAEAAVKAAASWHADWCEDGAEILTVEGDPLF